MGKGGGDGMDGRTGQGAMEDSSPTAAGEGESRSNLAEFRPNFKY